MREILFRGKRKDNSEWVEGDLLHFLGDKMFIQYYVEGHKVSFEVDPNSICEFTGLLDKNGKRIFEGDIVRGTDALERGLEVFGYVSHKNGSFVIAGDLMTHYRWLDYDVEVIGNIHDNPELLEVEE